MTSAIDIIEYLRTRDRSLRSSRFDGQAAVLELVKEVQGLPEAQSEEFFAALLQLIEQSDPELMAFAIEYLVHERSGEGASHLGQLVALADQTEVWFQPALLGLLRVGYRPIQELALKHLQ